MIVCTSSIPAAGVKVPTRDRMNGGPGAFGNVPESPADAAGKACVPVFLGEIPGKEI